MRWKGVIREGQRQVAVNRFAVQEAERHLAAGAASLHLQFDPVERMRAKEQFRRPVGEDAEHTQAVAVTPQVSEEVHGGQVRPVDIVEKQDEGAESGRLAEGVAELAPKGMLRTGGGTARRGGRS